MYEASEASTPSEQFNAYRATERVSLRANLSEAPEFCPVQIEGDEVPYHGDHTHSGRTSGD